MRAPRHFDPYAPPATESVVAGALPVLSEAAVARWALVIVAFVSFAIGAVETMQLGFGLRRFGGAEYIPRVVMLSAVRARAPAIAFAWTCLTAIGIAHRASRRAAAPVVLPRSLAPLLGTAIVLLYPVAIMCCVAGAFVIGAAAFGLDSREFLVSGRASIEPSDAAFGTLTSMLEGTLALLLLPRVTCIVAASRWRLVTMLVIAWVALSATVLVVQALLHATTSL